MTRIFISYSRRDKAVADYIGAELCNRGADVFIDYQKLIAGENFIGRLGREIEASDHLVLLLSPRSVESPWVQTEVAWAFTKKKNIVPVILEPATMVDFFVLANLEQVDFTRWSVDGKADGAVRKLAASLGLPTEPTCAELVPAVMVEAAPPEGEAEVAFSPDGKLLASGSSDNTVKLRDTASKQELTVLEGHVDTVRSVAFSPDGSLLASGSGDNTIKLWGLG